MTHRISLILGAEHGLCIGDGLPELQKRGTYLLEACLIPVGDFECTGTLLSHLEGVLQGVDLLDILRVCRIDHRAHYDTDVSRADPLLGQGVAARAVIDRRGVLVLIDYLHRHEALAGVGQHDCHRTGVEVEYRRRIQRVAVAPYNALFVNRPRLAVLPDFAWPPPFDITAQINLYLPPLLSF